MAGVMSFLPDKPTVTDTDLYRTATHYAHAVMSVQPEVVAALPDIRSGIAIPYLQMCLDGFAYAQSQLRPNRLKLLWRPLHEPTIEQTQFLAANMLAIERQPSTEPEHLRAAVKAGRYLMATTTGLINPDSQRISQMAQTYQNLRTH